MTLREIIELVVVQTQNDIEDIEDYLPQATVYINEGYGQLLEAWSGKRPGAPDADGIMGPPPLSRNDDTPEMDGWTHRAIADWATYRIYQNGNQARQGRGVPFYQSFRRTLAEINLQQGEKRGARDQFINTWP